MTRTVRIALFLLLAPVCPGMHAQAATTAAGTSQPQAPMRTPDQVVSIYAKRLELTPDQQAKLKPIVADRQQQMLAARNDTTVAGRAKAQKMKAITDAADMRIKAVLTPDQRVKFAGMEAETREKMQERRQAGGAPSN